jgi:hypothetical protein
MIYSIWAEEFAVLPEAIKYKMHDWLHRHGVDPTRVRGFTIVPERPAIWVEYIEVNALGLAYALDGKPQTVEEWIVIDEWGRDKPDFLEWMNPGENPPAALGEAGANTHKPFVVLSEHEWGAESEWGN